MGGGAELVRLTTGAPAVPPYASARLWRRHGWLPLVVSVGARSFWTDDARLAESVIAAGGVLASDGTADMALSTRRGAFSGADTWCSAIAQSGGRSDDRGLVNRRVRRVLGGARIQLNGLREARRLRRATYTSTVRIGWDDERASCPMPAGDRLVRGAVDLFPVGLAVVARADPDESSVFVAAVERAAVEAEGRMGLQEIRIRDTCVVGVGRRGVLRVGLGVGGEGVRRHVEGLDTLASLDPGRVVTSRTPRSTSDGVVGLGYWACESRLDGATAAPDDGEIADQCLAFQLGLAQAWRGPVSLEEHDSAARTVAGSSPAAGPAVAFVANRVAELLARHLGVLGHGDFFHGNLLVAGGQLVGVLDWERSGVGRPAGHDLVHHRVAALVPRRGGHYGRAVRDALERGLAAGDPLLAAYVGALGISLDDMRLTAIVGSCWLLHVAHEVDRLADNVADPVWRRENVDAPAAELARRLAAVDVALPSRR